MPVSPGCPANRAKRASRLVTRTRTVNPRIIRHILSGVASSLAITQRRWHALLAGTRGIEPPFSPLAALTSNEWLALWYTRSRRAFPCSACLSGLPNGDNCLLIDRYNRNDAMQLVGLRSGPPKTHCQGSQTSGRMFSCLNLLVLVTSKAGVSSYSTLNITLCPEFSLISSFFMSSTIILLSRAA